VQELLIINSISTVIVYIIFAISLMTIKSFQEEKILLLINSCSILLNVLGVEWFYQAIEQYDYITFRNLAFKCLALVLMFVFVHDTSDYVIYGAINVVGTTGSYVLNVINLRKYITLKPLGNYNFKRHIRPVFIFFALTVASNIYTNLDTVMLKFISGDEMTGYYNAAVKIKSVLMSIVTALSGVMIPRMSYYIYNKMFREFKDIVQRAMQFTLVLAIPFSAYFIEEAKAAITLLSSEAYLPAVVPMQIITPTIIFIGISQVTGMQVLIPLEKGHCTAISTVIGAIVDFTLNLFLIPRFGAAGAAAATLVAEIMVAGVQLWFLRSEKIKFFDGKDIGKILLACLIALLCVKGIKLEIAAGCFAELVVTSIVFFGVYGIILLVSKESIAQLYAKPMMMTLIEKIKR
jgi:O-antigen/teichoic acid export membrane protein